ncbi:MAG: APC family permease [Pseudomonadota bacterium]|nr:APC family permease [Pseudomonadota bacterium]
MHGQLKRTMGLGALVIYGVGDMLGAGIYGLVGKAAGLMGHLMWLGFCGAMLAALFTGLSYACIGSRYPRAAGAAFVTERAYGRPWLTWLVGLGVAASGLTSMATGSRVIAGYVQRLGVDLPTPVLALAALAIVAGVVFRGMRESTWFNVVCTTVEVAGLLFVIAVGLPYWGGVDLTTPPVGVEDTSAIARVLVQGAVLTFFSFIGFEDLLNVAEEAKNPERNLPIALVLALVIATIIYLSVCVTALAVLSPAELGASKAALVDVVGRAAPWFPPSAFVGIGIFAVANTALLNFVMGSRLLYGMSRQGLLPPALGRVHPTRHTPHVAILVLLGVVTVLMLTADIDALASATSLLLLTAFVVVNFALVRIKLKGDDPPGRFEVPMAVPVLGALICAVLIVARVFDPSADPRAPMVAAAILAVLALLYAVARPRGPVIVA